LTNINATGEILPIFVGFFGPKWPSQVDNPEFVCYMPALRVKSEAFSQLFTLPEFLSDQLKEDAACRFSFAITMSIKPSRR
jgi:hypothetical protein